MPLVNNLHLPQAARAGGDGLDVFNLDARGVAVNDELDMLPSVADAVTVRQNTAVSRSPASALELQPQTDRDFTRKRIAVTMGDPAGIGPELCLRLLQDSEVTTRVTPIVFGDAGVLRRVARQCGLPEPERVVDPSQWQQSGRELRQPAVLDLQAIEASVVTPGHVDAATGLASYRYVEAALAAALAGTVDAVTTGPIHKEALHAAGFPYPGHTEIFAAGTGTTRSCMMLTSPEITCSLVTTHIGYRDVPDQLSVARILEVIELTAEAMRRIRNRPPRLTVCGLNPHAGEHGLFGSGEEERLIAPAVAAARRLGIDVRGPLPPDTAFVPQQRQTTDAFVCMYHDQGLIPLKSLAFDTAVNVTLGLPIVRTSVDHGTALDIAWRGLAAASSLVQAVLLAARLANT